MVKYIFRGLENQTRQLFNTLLGTEYEFSIKSQNIVKGRSNQGQFGRKRANLGSKWPKPYLEAYKAKQDHFSTQFHVVSVDFT